MRSTVDSDETGIIGGSSGARALVVAHHHSSSPGGVGRHLTEFGYTLDTVTLGNERPVDLPDRGDYQVIVVLGSSHSVIELTRPDAPSRRWMAAEVEWIADAVTGGSRVLGICFGAQAMSRGLGGTVTRMPKTQVGWYELAGTADADPVFTGPWLEYHDDRFTVPDGARELAADRFCPQAFTVGRSLAVQFHPEADLPIVQAWVDRFPTVADGLAVGVDSAALVARTRVRQEASAARCRRLMEMFLALDLTDGALSVARRV